MTAQYHATFELDNIDLDILPGGSAEPVIHFPAVFVVFYWMVPANEALKVLF